MKNLDLVRYLETEYDISKIKYDNENIWYVLKPYLFDSILSRDLDKSRKVKFSISLVLLFTRSLFYGFKSLFKKYDYLVFSASERRRELNGVYYDRVGDQISDSKSGRILFVENPLYQGHKPIRKLYSQFIVSQTPFYLAAIILSLFYYKKKKAKGIEIIEQIVSDYEVHDFNYFSILKRYEGQYRVMKLFLKFYSIKEAFFVSVSTSLGYVKALKENRVKVTELQHGVINKEHYFYNSIFNTSCCHRPDELHVYSERELSVFDENNYYISPKNILVKGNYFIKKFKSEYKLNDELKKLREENKHILIFSGQTIFDEQSIKLLNEVALYFPNMQFIYLPRELNIDYTHYELEYNLKIIKQFNIYELFMIADIHSTVNSTCAIEAEFFNVPNLIFDYKNYGSNYYKDFKLKNTKYLKNIEEFKLELKNYMNERVS
ncbi:MAG: hypothetical protein N4A49_06395 [Marinifilaceae bacterium]|jgi:hypothetical protein|nr:hypothetical protein [Marinifilaceae bacterium]